MLSKIDIENQIGKGINIIPLNRENIKENSINLTLSKHAWTLIPKINGNQLGTSTNDNEYKNAVDASVDGFIVLKPHSTTIVYSEELIGLSEKYGGTFHAKVGIAAKGIIFSSTMLGPAYCGYLMVTLQNPTDSPIRIKIGSTFISLIFYKLDTPMKRNLLNPNSGSHIEKLASFGIKLSDELHTFFDEDWKKKIGDIRDRVKEEKDYDKIKKALQPRKRIIALINLVLYFILVGLVYYIASHFNITKIENIITASILSLLGEIMLSPLKIPGKISNKFLSGFYDV